MNRIWKILCVSGLLICLTLPVTLRAQAPRVAYDKTTQVAYVNGQKAFKVIKLGCGFGMPDCHFDIMDLADQRVIRVNYRWFNSPMETDRSNPNGTVRYYEFLFFNTQQKAEMKYWSLSEKRIARIIVENGLMAGGSLVQKAVDDFVFAHGTPYQQRVKF